MKKRNSLLLFIILIVLSGILLIVQQTMFKKTGHYALVEVDGKEVARLSLDTDTEIRIEAVADGYNIVKVQDGFVAVTEADCPDKVCVNTGKLWMSGGVIACLPHKLVVTVVEDGNDEKVDGVAG